MNKSIDTYCFWCKKLMYQRIKTYQRQLKNYGHNCCKNCFGNEQSFKDARKRIMLSNNPFKGKKHSLETKLKLALIKKGKVAWNKGLDKTHPSIKKYGIKVSEAKRGKSSGAKNPNWKGGKCLNKRKFRNDFKEWIAFKNTIIDRDTHCWKCNSKHRLEVHHIASRRSFIHLEFDENNCIVLCHDCHMNFHKRFGRKFFKPNDTINWLNENRDIKDRVILC